MDINKQMWQEMVKKGFTTAQKLLQSGMNVNCLRTNATLRNDEWKIMDEAIIESAQIRLVGVADLRTRGLVYPIANGLGKTILQGENVSDMNDAEVSMDGVTAGKNDAVNFELVGLPLPLIHKEYQISIRKLAASRNMGEPLDTTQARLAARKVADMQENILFNGYSSYAFGGYTIYGYTDYPNKNNVTMGTSWASDTDANILTDVLAAKQASITDRFFGPWQWYLPTAFETNFDNDFSTAKGDLTIRERILKIIGMSGISIADKLSGTKAIQVQMTEDVVRMVEGLPITNVEWQSAGNMIFHFKVMTIAVPQIRDDQSGRCGVTVVA